MWNPRRQQTTPKPNQSCGSASGLSGVRSGTRQERADGFTRMSNSTQHQTTKPKPCITASHQQPEKLRPQRTARTQSYPQTIARFLCACPRELVPREAHAPPPMPTRTYVCHTSKQEMAKNKSVDVDTNKTTGLSSPWGGPHGDLLSNRRPTRIQVSHRMIPHSEKITDGSNNTQKTERSSAIRFLLFSRRLAPSLHEEQNTTLGHL